MPKTAFATTVAAPVDLIWELLLDKVEHPEKYVPGVSDVKILERSGQNVLRQMSVAGKEVLRE